jgi:phosphoribosylformylglycinamidine cyclo-ligase
MLRVFNCGVGMVLVTAEPDAAMAALREAGENPDLIGRIEAGEGPASAEIATPPDWLA